MDACLFIDCGEWKSKQELLFSTNMLWLYTESSISFLIQVSPGDTGWDVFSLDYHVDGPIATVMSYTAGCDHVSDIELSC